MSQHARNNPDQPPRHEDFGGGVFSPQADCFRAARTHEDNVKELHAEPQCEPTPPLTAPGEKGKL